MKKIEVNTLILTAVTMVAFAGNSFLCRAALGAQQIDAATFTLVRLLSGAAVLVVLLRTQGGVRLGGSWAGAFALLFYAVCFSMAYVQLSTGTGALVLFGFVQLTMIAWAAKQGDVLKGVRLVGALMAIGGLVYLLWPTLQVPDSLLAALSMAIAGISWGVYSVVGKGSKTPLADTAGNFSRAGLVILPVWAALYYLGTHGTAIPLITHEQGIVLHKVIWPMPTWGGLMLAMASGGLASGVGYAIWYKVLPALPTTSAASVQLSVPIIAAVAGSLMLHELFSLRLILSMVLTLGGIYWVFSAKKP